jgi:hypothetical protein
VEEKVQYPAIGLMVVGGIGVLFALLRLALSAMSMGISGLASSQSGGGPDMMINMLSGGVGLLFAGLGLVVAAAIVYGGMKMYRFENYTLAMTAAVLACIPCVDGCCCVAVPIGIWALVTLTDQAVKDSFTS